MFQSIYNAHLRDRLKDKKLRNQLEIKYSQSLSRDREMIGVTNLFILASAALSTSLPGDSTGAARARVDIETLNAGLSDLSAHIQAFDASGILQDLEQLANDVIATARHLEDGGALDDTQALAIIFYIKNATAPVVAGTLLDLRKVRGKLYRSGKQEAVAKALQDIETRVLVLKAALLRKTPAKKKPIGRALFDAIVAEFQIAAKYFAS